MLREIQSIQQIQGQPHRRWFQDSALDLLLWTADTGEIVGFQLCYNKGPAERIVTWTHAERFRHEQVDNGEQCPTKYKAIPICTPDTSFDPGPVAEQFQAKSHGLAASIATFVCEKLLTYRPAPGDPLG